MSIVKYSALGLGFAMLVSAVSSTGVNAAEDWSSEGGVVTDSTTNLQWQDSYDGNGGEVISGSFVEATQYCSELTLGEKQDWRMPTREELISTVDKARASDNDPSINEVFTMVLVEEGYLSSTHYEDDDETVWLLDYTHGDSVDVALTTTDGYHIRCVRSN